MTAGSSAAGILTLRSSGSAFKAGLFLAIITSACEADRRPSPRAADPPLPFPREPSEGQFTRRQANLLLRVLRAVVSSPKLKTKKMFEDDEKDSPCFQECPFILSNPSVSCPVLSVRRSALVNLPATLSPANLSAAVFEPMSFGFPAEAVSLPNRQPHRGDGEGDDNSSGGQGNAG